MGRFKANDLGLFDILGNVMEWCQDPALPYQPAADGRPSEDALDPMLPVPASQERALRGGSFYHHALNVRTASHLIAKPKVRNPAVGLRVARTWIEP